MAVRYKKRLFTYFLIVFTTFSVAVVLFERYRERDYRIEMLSTLLDNYSYVAQENTSHIAIPDNMRITRINEAGTVVFDNNVSDTSSMENHATRPEITLARKNGSGYDIRTSSTTGVAYFYYARKLPDGYIRMAMPYNSAVKSHLTPDTGFLIFTVVLFLVTMVALWFIARRYGQDLQTLKNRLTQEAKARAKLKAEMTSAIAHELRTPTSSIRSYSETLCTPGIDDEHKDAFIRRIHDASVRLSELLENVSLLTKMEEAPANFNSVEVNVLEVIEGVVEEFQSVGSKGKPFTVVCKVADDVVVRGSKILIYSIWRNLIENSIKYGGDSVKIVIKSEPSEDENYYCFSLRDNGSGLEEKHLDRLFERFYRVDKGRTRDDGGSGLGLSIVAHAVKHHQGSITAENSDMGGLTIRFSLHK